jgi:hypothetical protein
MVDLYRRRIAALVREAAKEDPELILGLIKQLKEAGEIDADDLGHIERIARKWIKIAQENLAKGGHSQQ